MNLNIQFSNEDAIKTLANLTPESISRILIVRTENERGITPMHNLVEVSDLEVEVTEYGYGYLHVNGVDQQLDVEAGYSIPLNEIAHITVASAQALDNDNADTDGDANEEPYSRFGDEPLNTVTDTLFDFVNFGRKVGGHVLDLINCPAENIRPKPENHFSDEVLSALKDAASKFDTEAFRDSLRTVNIGGNTGILLDPFDVSSKYDASPEEFINMIMTWLHGDNAEATPAEDTTDASEDHDAYCGPCACECDEAERDAAEANDDAAPSNIDEQGLAKQYAEDVFNTLYGEASKQGNAANDLSDEEVADLAFANPVADEANGESEDNVHDFTGAAAADDDEEDAAEEAAEKLVIDIIRGDDGAFYMGNGKEYKLRVGPKRMKELLEKLLDTRRGTPVTGTCVNDGRSYEFKGAVVRNVHGCAICVNGVAYDQTGRGGDVQMSITTPDNVIEDSITSLKVYEN